ncbi:DUF6890 family protein [Edwardsiella tarda]|uniref:DUF6890 family protein n=1 Tax=Edwardsiella tarda TaxID=636 RepID=UPI00356B6836
MRAQARDHRKKLIARARAIDGNAIEQILALRRHYLPGEPDDDESFARALWLESRYWENFRIAAANGVATAFNGE